MYDYYFSYWEVDIILEDGANLIYRFTTEEDAVRFAREHYKMGHRVTIRSVQTVESWQDIYEDIDTTKAKFIPFEEA